MAKQNALYRWFLTLQYPCSGLCPLISSAVFTYMLLFRRRKNVIFLHLKSNFLGLKEFALFLWKQNAAQRKTHMYLKTLLEICAHLHGEAALGDGDVTAGAGDRCCCSFSSGSQGVQLLPLGSDSPNCHGWHWGPGTCQGLPPLSGGDRSCAPTDGNGGFFLALNLHLLGPNVVVFALTRSSWCWICRWDFFIAAAS